MGCGHSPRPSCCGPLVDLREQGLFLLDGGQGLLQDFGRRLLEAALARAAEVMRRLVQAEQRTGLLGQRGVGREIVAGQVGKAEIVLGREFPGQVQLNGLGHGLGLGDELGGGGLFELQQDVRGLDLDPLARIELNLGRGVGFGQDTMAGHEFAGFFKQCMHRAADSPMGAIGRCPGPHAPWPGAARGGAGGTRSAVLGGAGPHAAPCAGPWQTGGRSENRAGRADGLWPWCDKKRSRCKHWYKAQAQA
jgi:hypothetical protein